jgi:hypothetical protein
MIGNTNICLFICKSSPMIHCGNRGFLVVTWQLFEKWKQRICFSNSGSAHFHVSWLSDFIFYQKPLYKSLHQSFFYSFITILPRVLPTGFGKSMCYVPSFWTRYYMYIIFFLMVICNSLLLLKSLPINIINCIKLYVNCSALTGAYDWQ